MIRFDLSRIDALLSRFQDQTWIVAGDLMLDRYLWGKVSRISPEAPVPVVEIESESHCFGGAANVALNVQSLSGKAIPVGVIGDDPSGKVLRAMFEQNGFQADGLIAEPGRHTTVKTRIIANGQHVVRTDREVRDPITKRTSDRLIKVIEKSLNLATGIIVEDYNKGLLTPEFIKQLINLARSRDKMVLVDPKFAQFFDYAGVTLFKPNRKEAGDALGLPLDSDNSLEEAGRRLLSKLECQAVLITLGDQGMALFEKDSPMIKVPTQAVKVHDVSGAGDTVIAAMSVVLGSGGTFQEAASIANHAAGIVCGEVGIVPIQRNRLLETLKTNALSERNLP